MFKSLPAVIGTCRLDGASMTTMCVSRRAGDAQGAICTWCSRVGVRVIFLRGVRARSARISIISPFLVIYLENIRRNHKNITFEHHALEHRYVDEPER